MATFTQIQQGFIKVFRAVRRMYRIADTSGEKFEREMDRLIKRKRLIQPDDLGTAINLYNAYSEGVRRVAAALNDAAQFLSVPKI